MLQPNLEFNPKQKNSSGSGRTDCAVHGQGSVLHWQAQRPHDAHRSEDPQCSFR